MSLVAYENSDSEEEVEKPTVKEKKTIKITIPSIDNDSDEEEPSAKKAKRSDNRNKSGLLSMLPPPKVHADKVLSFIPNAVKKNPKATTTTTKSKTIPKIVTQVTSESSKIPTDSDDSDDDIPVAKFDEELWNKIATSSKRNTAFYTSVNKNASEVVAVENNVSSSVIDIAPETEKPYEGLDNLAFKELVGKSKQRVEEINVIDIHEDEIRPDKSDWLKSLTDPNHVPKTDVDNPVNDTCKKKHHITYLAQQAKANEIELQNQWAASRFARKQTQAKYGF